MKRSTIPVLIPLLFAVAAGRASGSQTAPARDLHTLPAPEARIQGRVVHDEDSRPARRFRLHLRGEAKEGTEIDGWEYPRLKGGWICTPFNRGGGEEDEREGPFEEERLGSIRFWDTGPKEYRFDRGVRGGAGRFEWAAVADGCDLARGTVTLEKGRAADLGEVRLRRGSAVIDGYVVDPLGRPVAEATVRLAIIPGLESGFLGRRNRRWTDKSGYYRFDRVPSGKGYLHVEPGPVAVMPPVPLTVEPASTKRVEFRPQVGALQVAVDVPKGAEWTRPFMLCLQGAESRTFVRWPVFPPQPEPGSVPRSFGISSGVGCRRRPDSIELRAVRSGEPPAWEPRPPTVSGEGSPQDVAIDEGGSSFRITNVPVGEWRVSLRAVEGDRPLAEPEDGLGFSTGRERWEAPPLRPSPEIVKVRAGLLTPLSLLTK
jgi:hypothetical protein